MDEKVIVEQLIKALENKEITLNDIPQKWRELVEQKLNEGA